MNKSNRHFGVKAGLSGGGRMMCERDLPHLPVCSATPRGGPPFHVMIILRGNRS